MEIDYSSFLQVLPDGSIWWPLEIAVKLGAGFLPVRDDSQNLEPTLQARNNRVRAGERTLLSDFTGDNYTGAHPRIVQRDDGRYVEAQGFLTWLLKYLNSTSSAPFPFPDALAEAVTTATKKPKGRRRKSSEFNSLTLALEGLFETRFEDLPDALSWRVREEFFPVTWANLSAEQRRYRALELDYQSDPETEQDRQHWWDFFERMREVRSQIVQWHATAAPTANDMALRETRLTELQRELAKMEAQERQAGGDYLPKPPANRAIHQLAGEPVEYIEYPDAMARLEAKLGATVEELAAWIWRGPAHGGLTAYMNANELDPPPRFRYPTASANQDYVAPLMACWFTSTEIDHFKPTERYMTGQSLIERWSSRPHINATAFIQAKIAESRLQDIHPIYGGTVGTFLDEIDFPPLSTGLFALSQVEEIEEKAFGKQVSIQRPSAVGSSEWRRQNAVRAANAKHDKPGGARDKKRLLLEIWSSGKYTNRDRCAEEECGALDMSFAAARRALTNAPTPSRC